MTTNFNAERLRALMTKHKLTRAAVAELAMVSVKAVDAWLAPPGLVSYRPMPDRALALIESQLKTKRPKKARKAD